MQSYYQRYLCINYFTLSLNLAFERLYIPGCEITEIVGCTQRISWPLVIEMRGCTQLYVLEMKKLIKLFCLLRLDKHEVKFLL